MILENSKPEWIRDVGIHPIQPTIASSNSQSPLESQYSYAILTTGSSRGPRRVERRPSQIAQAVQATSFVTVCANSKTLAMLKRFNLSAIHGTTERVARRKMSLTRSPRLFPAQAAGVWIQETKSTPTMADRILRSIDLSADQDTWVAPQRTRRLHCQSFSDWLYHVVVPIVNDLEFVAKFEVESLDEGTME